MENSLISLHIDNSVAIVTFKRPKALNAISSPLLTEFNEVLSSIEDNEKIRVLVLTGAGEKAFIAGADIGEINQLTPLAARRFADQGQRVIHRLYEMVIPVIAAVNGYALGGGFEMALACDFIYASRTATFGLPEINLGIIPGFGGTQRLARLVGGNLARELIFSGKMLTAEEAHEAHIVSRLFAPGELMEGVLSVAETITKKGRASLMLAKTAIRQGIDTDLNTGLAIERDAFAMCQTSPDSREGTGAFLEKRKPDFTGRRDV